MIQMFLDALAWLSKYGLIDIAFGIGIFSYLIRLLRPKIIDRIEQVDIGWYFEADGRFEVRVRNDTRDPLYIYRCCFRPGYFTSKIVWNKPVTYFVRHWEYWSDDKFPIHSDEKRERNIQGEYVLKPFDDGGNKKEFAFLERGSSAYYRLRLKPGSDFVQVSANLQNYQAGMLELHLVHGANQRILQTQL